MVMTVANAKVLMERVTRWTNLLNPLHSVQLYLSAIVCRLLIGWTGDRFIIVNKLFISLGLLSSFNINKNQRNNFN